MPFLAGAQHLQNLHPLVVHFPIAYLLGSALFYFLSWALRRPKLAEAAFLLLLLGAVSTALAIQTGLYAQSGVMVARSVRARLLEPHETLMLATGALCFVLTVWALAARPFPTRGRFLFLLLFLVLIGTLALGADFGGRMVYDYNAGGNACPQPIEYSK